jgi:hypothetical protein
MVSPNMHRRAEVGIFRNYEGSLTPSLQFQSCKHRVLDDSYVKIRVLKCARQFLRRTERSVRRSKRSRRVVSFVLPPLLHYFITRRGDITATSPEKPKMLKLMDIQFVHSKCDLRSDEWISFMKITSVMKDFASSCIPKVNFPGVDACLFDLSTCLDYGIQMDI